MCGECPNDKCDSKVVLHYRNGTQRNEVHSDWNAYQLASIFNKTAFDYGVTDVWVERVSK